MSRVSLDKPFAARASTLPSSQPSPQRRPSPLADKARGRPYDIATRLQPPSSEIIANLLSAFPAIHQDDEDTAPGQSQPPHSATGPSSSPSSPRMPQHQQPPLRQEHQQWKPPSDLVRDPDGYFTEYRHPDTSTEEMGVEETAAEAPIIRTSKPPSGFSKLTAQARPKRSRPAAPSARWREQSPLVSPGQSPASSQTGPIGTAYGQTSKGRSPHGSRFSLSSSKFGNRSNSLLHSEPPNIPSVPRSDRASPARGQDAAAYPDVPRGGYVRTMSGLGGSSSQPPSSWNAGHATARSPARPSTDEDFPVPPPIPRSRPAEPSSKSPIYSPNSSRPRTANRDGETPGLVDGKTTVPSRKSSLRHAERPAFLAGLLHSRSREQVKTRDPTVEKESPPAVPSKGRIYIRPDDDESPHPPPPTQPPPPPPKDPPAPPFSSKVSQDLARDEQETDTERRIRELQEAARERRSMSLTSQSQSAANALRPPLGFTYDPVKKRLVQELPDTTRAQKQLEEAQRVEEYVVRPGSRGVESGRQGPPRPSVQNIEEHPVEPLLEFSEIPEMNQPVMNGSANRNKVSFDTGPTPLSPGASRASSRTRRWSFGKGSALGSPTRSTFATRRSPMEEQRRDSIDESVTEYLKSERFTQKVVVAAENRSVVFSEVGDPHGSVVFCCVGMGLNRFITTFYDELATSLKLRLITPDRPGIGDSEPYWSGASKPPLSWPDDIQAICDELDIRNFSLLAHSAGTIYALATALRMRERIRGKIHLLAPWIPPSQMSPAAGLPSSSPSGKSLPRSQRFLRKLPESFLRFTTTFNGGPLGRQSNANKSTASSIKGRPSASQTPAIQTPAVLSTLNTGANNSPRPSTSQNFSRPLDGQAQNQARGRWPYSRRPSRQQTPHGERAAPLDSVVNVPTDHDMTAAVLKASNTSPSPLPSRPATAVPSHARGGFGHHRSTSDAAIGPPAAEFRPGSSQQQTSVEARRRIFDQRLTHAIWYLATTNANPGIDLLVCLERNQPIGFRYADVNAGTGTIIHHGSKDPRVPVDNVKWLGKVMKNSEVRVIEGEGHGLMGSAGVISGVLEAIGKELEEVLLLEDDQASF